MLVNSLGSIEEFSFNVVVKIFVVNSENVVICYVIVLVCLVLLVFNVVLISDCVVIVSELRISVRRFYNCNMIWWVVSVVVLNFVVIVVVEI